MGVRNILLEFINCYPEIIVYLEKENTNITVSRVSIDVLTILVGIRRMFNNHADVIRVTTAKICSLIRKLKPVVDVLLCFDGSTPQLKRTNFNNNLFLERDLTKNLKFSLTNLVNNVIFDSSCNEGEGDWKIISKVENLPKLCSEWVCVSFDNDLIISSVIKSNAYPRWLCTRVPSNSKRSDKNKMILLDIEKLRRINTPEQFATLVPLLGCDFLKNLANPKNLKMILERFKDNKKDVLFLDVLLDALNHLSSNRKKINFQYWNSYLNDLSWTLNYLGGDNKSYDPIEIPRNVPLTPYQNILSNKDFYREILKIDFLKI